MIAKIAGNGDTTALGLAAIMGFLARTVPRRICQKDAGTQRVICIYLYLICCVWPPPSSSGK